MTPERHAKLQEIFEAAIRLTDPQRSAYLDQACTDDPGLRDRVNQLLLADEETDTEEPIAAPTGPAVMECPKCWRCFEAPLSACPRDGAKLQVAFAGPQLIDGKYLVERRLGRGGMGAVYLARDTRLPRDVAIKVVQERFSARFEREARAIGALSHPNICTLFDVGPNHLVMEYIEGETLAERLNKGPLPLNEVLTIAIEVASALDAAHRKRIIHRDLKPGNIMLTGNGTKLLDFGLAKYERHSADEETLTNPLTGAAQLVGTLPYMSPEQLRSNELDARSDIFAFGAVLYEMLAGLRAFQRPTAIETMAAVASEEPRPLHEFVKNLPEGLERIVRHCLCKKPEERYGSIAEVERELEDCRSLAFQPASGINLRALLRQGRRPRVVVPVALIVVALVSLSAWWIQRSSRARWARYQALPEIAQLVEKGEMGRAYDLAVQAERYIPDDPMLGKVWADISLPSSITSTPSGVSVFRKDYKAPQAGWELVGRTPIEKRRMPRVYSRWKFELKGFATVERAGFPSDSVMVAMDEEAKTPPGMIHHTVDARESPVTLSGLAGFEALPAVPLGDYWMDRYEVTNQQYKKFLDEGGYSKQEYWKQEFRKEGRVLPWTEAMTLLQDSTGRPGPATWVQGEYPRGQEDFPVTGVSWYEAAAYAEYAGKKLPTIYHWTAAASPDDSARIVPASNFGGQGPASVGTYRGTSRSGEYDMGGNVKEWCWNEANSGKHLILGGAWDEPIYMFNDPDARSPFERSAGFGFRCAKYVSTGAATRAAGPITIQARDYNREKPVSDQTFQLYKGLYSYDKTPLDAVVEATDQTEEWKRERITFAAAYGNERVTAYLFLPKRASPPFQTVVYFPEGGALHSHSSENATQAFFDYLIKSGRAVLLPVLKGTYERSGTIKSGFPDTSINHRDHVISWSKDLGRSIDYLETRSEIDRNKLAYEGASWGAVMAPLMIAVEPRFKVSVLILPGFYFQECLPEADPFNFAPRMKIPVLLLHGRYDFIFPVETNQKPFFRLIGTPAEHKRSVLYDTGHNIPRNERIKETLNWLDRYLGPVK